MTADELTQLGHDVSEAIRLAIKRNEPETPFQKLTLAECVVDSMLSDRTDVRWVVEYLSATARRFEFYPRGSFEGLDLNIEILE